MQKESDVDSRRDQVAFYKSGVDPEEEITRPRRYPAFVQWLIQSKLEAALRLYAPGLRPGLTALVICCGSGLDLEFLTTRDLTALGLDLSIDAVRRAKARSNRFGASYHLACGDATVLPFRDASFDIVFVHDGLHHLEDPYAAVVEMTRVAAGGVVIAEPARSALTRLAVWMGISTDYEEAGNFVNRISPARLNKVFRQAGLTQARTARELCCYQPWTYKVYQLGEAIVGLTAMRRFHRGVNKVLGRWGNSLRAAAWR